RCIVERSARGDGMKARSGWWTMALGGLALAGCASLRSPQPVAEPAGFDAADTHTTATFLEVAAIREDTADWDGALAKLDKALALQPRSRTAALRRAQLLLLAADANGDTPALDEIRAALAQAAETEDAELLLTRAWLDTVEGRDDAALADVQRATDAAPDDARVQWMAARLLARHGGAEGGVTAADRAMERDPRSHAAQRERARARLRTGEFEGSITDLGAQLRAHPDDQEARELQGETFWRLANYPAAMHAYESIPADRRT